MAIQSLPWNSFWDVVTPRRAAELLLLDFGEAAVGAAATCASAADADGRHEDASFWRAVIAELSKANEGVPLAPLGKLAPPLS